MAQPPFPSATVPTVGSAIEALTDLSDEIVETLKQIAAISAELDARHHIQVEDVRRVGMILSPCLMLPVFSIARPITRHRLGDLDIRQERTLICRELERSLGRTRNTADTLLGKPGVTPKH